MVFQKLGHVTRLFGFSSGSESLKAGVCIVKETCCYGNHQQKTLMGEVNMDKGLKAGAYLVPFYTSLTACVSVSVSSKECVSPEHCRHLLTLQLLQYNVI